MNILKSLWIRLWHGSPKRLFRAELRQFKKQLDKLVAQKLTFEYMLQAQPGDDTKKIYEEYTQKLHHMTRMFVESSERYKEIYGEEFR